MTEARGPRLEPRRIDPAEAASCFALMRQLRPHLGSAEEFAERFARQARDGYQLVALESEGRPLALAGYRLTETLVHGRFLYVDDLVVDDEARRQGLGARLIRWLTEEAQRQGCAKLVLDAALANPLAHRFYFREGLLATALRFTRPLS
jgi:GNAT superfamily N-acetyltransferase